MSKIGEESFYLLLQRILTVDLSINCMNNTSSIRSLENRRHFLSYLVKLVGITGMRVWSLPPRRVWPVLCLRKKVGTRKPQSVVLVSGGRVKRKPAFLPDAGMSKISLCFLRLKTLSNKKIGKRLKIL